MFPPHRYRCSRTYMNAGTLCRGFEESVNLKRLRRYRQGNRDLKESELQNLHNQHKHLPHHHGDHSEQTYLKEDPSLYQEYQGHAQLDGGPGHKSINSTGMIAQSMVRNDVSSGKQTDDDENDNPKWTRKKIDSCRHTIGKLLQSSLIPKLLIASVLLLMFYVLVSTASVVLSVDTLSDVGAFRLFMAGLEAQVNQTNWYLSQQAAHFNEVTMRIYESQMRSELLHLQSMLEYFNNGR